MLLDLENTFHDLKLSELLRSEPVAPAAYKLREVYRARRADTEGPDNMLLVVSDDRSAIESELDNLKRLESTQFAVPHVVVDDGNIAAFAVTLPDNAVTLSDFLKRDGVMRWDVALRLIYDYIHALTLLNLNVRIPDLAPGSLYAVPDKENPALLHAIIPMINPVRSFTDSRSWTSMIYYAPEQLNGLVNGRSLVFSATLLLVRMIQNSFPWKFTPASDLSLEDFSVAFAEAVKTTPRIDVPGRYRRILARGLALDPDSRYSSIWELGDVIFNMLKDLGIEPSVHIASQEIAGSDLAEPLELPGGPSDNEPRKPDVTPVSDDEDLDDFFRRAEEYGRSRSEEPKANIEISRVEGGGFADVAGLDDIKKKMTRNFISIVRNPELAKTFRIEPPNGLLLWGPPGNGKSFISRKLAEESGLLYTLVNPGDIGSIYVHGTQGMIADLFKRCEDAARKEKTGVLMVLEEFDSLVPSRAEKTSGNNRSDEVAEFLTRLNNCASKGVYVVATTNRIDAIDPAVMRKGRMDEVIYVGLPDEKVRHKLFELELRDRPHDDLDLNKLVSLTDGFTSGDISFLVKESARKSFEASLETPDKHVVAISQTILEATIREAHPSVTSGERHNYEKLRDSYDRNRHSAPKVGFK